MSNSADEYEKTIPSPRQIVRELNKTVSGQQHAKQTLSYAVYMHKLRFIHNLMVKPKDKSRARPLPLLMGPTGCGKTLLAVVSARIVDLPFHHIDASQLTPEGWVGDSLKDELIKYYKSKQETSQDPSCIYTQYSMAHGIIFLDEFDKLGIPAVGGGGTDHSRTAQFSLLRVLEGEKMTVEGVEYDTSHLLFVIAGAFNQIRENRDRTKKNLIGFTHNNADDGVPLLHKDLIDGGIIPELVGRISLITELQPLTRDELRGILEMPNSVLFEYKRILKEHGIKIRLSDEQKEGIIDKAVKSPMGARSIQTSLDELLQEYLYDKSVKWRTR